MSTPQVPQEQIGTVFTWIDRYGLATVTTIILLCYVLYTDFARQKELSEAIQAIARSQIAISESYRVQVALLDKLAVVIQNCYVNPR